MGKMIIFDCDGTLVDSEIIAAQVFSKEWTALGVEMSEQFFLTHFVGTGVDAEIVKEMNSRLPAGAQKIVEEKFLEQISQRLNPVRGIPEVLAKIPCAICVASNSDSSYLKKALATAKLDQFFGKKVYSAHDIGKFKPLPDLFLHAARESGVPPDQCLVIEDSVAGISAAKNAGMRVAVFLAGLHLNPAGRERLFSAKADHYCETPEDLSRTIQNHLDRG